MESGTDGWLGGALAPGSDAPSPDPATEPSRPLRSRGNCKDADEADAFDMRKEKKSVTEFPGEIRSGPRLPARAGRKSGARH